MNSYLDELDSIDYLVREEEEEYVDDFFAKEKIVYKNPFSKNELNSLHDTLCKEKTIIELSNGKFNKFKLLEKVERMMKNYA